MEWREGGRTYKGYTTFYWGVHYFSRLPIVWRAIEWAKMMLSTAGSRNALMARQIALNYRHHAFHSVPYIHTYLYAYIHSDCRLGYEENFPYFTHFSLIVAWPPEVKTWVAKYSAITPDGIYLPKGFTTVAMVGQVLLPSHLMSIPSRGTLKLYLLPPR